MTVKTIKLKSKSTFNLPNIADYKGIIILTSIFVCGIILGAGTIGKSNSKVSTVYSQLFSSFFNWQINSNFTTLLCISFLFTSAILLIIVFASQSCIGIPIIFTVDILIGLTMGIFSGTVIKQYGITGFEYNILTIVPAGSITVLLMLLLSNNSLMISENLLKYSLGIENENGSVFKSYILYVIKIMLISLVSSFIFATTVTLFIKLFNF